MITPQRPFWLQDDQDIFQSGFIEPTAPRRQADSERTSSMAIVPDVEDRGIDLQSEGEVVAVQIPAPHYLD